MKKWRKKLIHVFTKEGEIAEEITETRLHIYRKYFNADLMFYFKI